MACVTSVKMNSIASKSFVASQQYRKRMSRRNNVVRAELFTSSMVTISACNAAMLALGRFVAASYQKKTADIVGLPTQNGVTHFEAGDRLAEEATFITQSCDPSGFNIIDVFAWGSLGHAIGFAALAAASIH
eukprot:TRINITY_DN12528_c0_g1_i3.p2 TRINITY_DN12528_c0_g1~~TRINITY_DN12528_c0_g1_i3.p2  ORF type:complete len:132 (-),score=27.70 TRINITY_DN12528_c0_g1_i3:16-411(-)